MKKLILIFLFCCNIVYSQTISVPSTYSLKANTQLHKNTPLFPQSSSTVPIPKLLYPDYIKNNNALNSKAFKMLEVPVILALTSFAYMPFDNNFYATRNNYIPNFKHSYDDYTQYLPALVMLVTKASGLEGRSKWGKMLVADAFSIAIMATMVNVIKPSAGVQRPDAAVFNSFPSGHTATAFMTASMLHKEYGLVNKWFSIGAYSVAALTGITRILNNRHWASDVFMGAAIGILSVELGYLFADLIYKNGRGNTGREDIDYLYFGEDYKPSFVSLYSGISTYVGSYITANGNNMNISKGSQVGFEGAGFINKYFGIGGQFTFSTLVTSLNEYDNMNYLSMLNGAVGGFFSYPLADRLRVGSKLLFGMDYIIDSDTPQSQLGMNDYNMTIQTGLSVSYLTGSNFGFKAFCDYRSHLGFIGSTAANEFIFGVSMELMLGRDMLAKENRAIKKKLRLH